MPKLTTPLCRYLGITRPIVQAPIAASPELVVGVCNAGGLGMIPVTWIEGDELRSMISDVQNRTDCPFGINVVLSLMEAPQHANVDLALEAGVPVVSTFWGDPAALVERIHAAGAIAMHTVGSAEEARRAVDSGVDVVVAQGVEAGGHVWGQVATMVLTPAVVDAVPKTHVIAAGGIADGRGLAAALALGAGAAWIGTRLLLSQEGDFHLAYRERVKAARETDTVLSCVFDIGWPDAPHRCLRNDTLDAWSAAGEPPSGQRPNEGEIVAHDEWGRPIPRYSMEDPVSGTTGSVTSLAMYAGQSAGLTTQEAPVAEILASMVAEASAILTRLVANEPLRPA